MVLCKCDRCWEQFRKSEGFEAFIAGSLDKHSMELTGISGPSREAIEAVARADDWRGLELDERLNTCHVCVGSGVYEDFDGINQPCSRCSGRGWLPFDPASLVPSPAEATGGEQ